jgi:hypothetical protein
VTTTAPCLRRRLAPENRCDYEKGGDAENYQFRKLHGFASREVIEEQMRGREGG